MNLPPRPIYAGNETPVDYCFTPKAVKTREGLREIQNQLQSGGYRHGIFLDRDILEQAPAETTQERIWIRADTYNLAESLSHLLRTERGEFALDNVGRYIVPVGFCLDIGNQKHANPGGQLKLTPSGRNGIIIGYDPSNLETFDFIDTASVMPSNREELARMSDEDIRKFYLPSCPTCGSEDMETFNVGFLYTSPDADSLAANIEGGPKGETSTWLRVSDQVVKNVRKKQELVNRFGKWEDVPDDLRKLGFLTDYGRLRIVFGDEEEAIRTAYGIPHSDLGELVGFDAEWGVSNQFDKPKESGYKDLKVRGWMRGRSTGKVNELQFATPMWILQNESTEKKNADHVPCDHNTYERLKWDKRAENAEEWVPVARATAELGGTDMGLAERVIEMVEERAREMEDE
ncbi:hypothetical protein ACFL1B_00800 [Nanoarchaeota archaeon]